MKKVIATILIATTSLMMVACGSSSGDTKVIESSSNSSNGAAASSKSESGFTFEYEGLEITVDADVAPVIEKLGEPSKYFESPSCAAEGIGKLYTYSDFEIQTYPDGDVDRVLYVRLRTDNVSTKEGVDLSSSKDDIISAYGEPTSEGTGSMTYENNGTSLIFIFDGDALSSIEYDSELNK